MIKKNFIKPYIEIIKLQSKASICAASCLERCAEIGVCEPYCYVDCVKYGNCPTFQKTEEEDASIDDPVNPEIIQPPEVIGEADPLEQ